MNRTDFERQRDQLIEHELRMLGIGDDAVITAMKAVPREEFVSKELQEFAYRNAPLPIGAGQTISQPLIVAFMIQALELSPHERVLEIGAGSGYAAAVLSRIVKAVYAIERHGELAETARERLKRLGYDNVHILHGDGTLGWPEQAPFDAITVAAGGPGIPRRFARTVKHRRPAHHSDRTGSGVATTDASRAPRAPTIMNTRNLGAFASSRSLARQDGRSRPTSNARSCRRFAKKCGRDFQN